MLAMMGILGHERFAVVGHDRGGLVAVRLALNYPDAIRRAGVLDCVPVSEHLARMSIGFATSYWHLRGGPAVQLHQVALRPAAVEPDVAEVVPEPVRIDPHIRLPAAPPTIW
jgi:pimeloyl-ACP methyl ester carboxylesterase